MYLFMDTETGGLTPDRSLLTVSMIPVDKDFQIVPIDYFDPIAQQVLHTDAGLYVAVKHETYVVDKEALAVNKINIAEHDVDAVPLPLVRELLTSFIRHTLKAFDKKYLVPAGHNVAFDLKFIKAYLLTEQEWDTFFTYPSLDTAAAARFLNAAGVIGGGYSLTSLRNKFVPHMSGELHNAETDNLTTIELAKRLTAMVPKTQ
jgi:DNA polymerase III epsilon subunit-like protein